MDIRDEDLRAVARLWGELAEFPAAQADEALRHCFTRLASLIGAENLFWVGATRDGDTAPGGARLQGWWPKAVGWLHPSTQHDRVVGEILRHMKENVVDPQTEALVQRAGVTRAFLRAELVDDATWERSWLVNESMRPCGVEYRMVGAHALDARSESYIGLDRGPRERPFAMRERDLLHLFLMGCPGFHREQLLVRGFAYPPLTPRERDVLRLLLTDLSEREIGESLGLTWRTTHQYVVSILRKFGVKGRIGLMALWLRHTPSGKS
jgi:DNA-binding CsgD family transcriptional regulator